MRSHDAAPRVRGCRRRSSFFKLPQGVQPVSERRVREAVPGTLNWQERLRAHGFSPMRKLLLVGPLGTGKTMTAATLAGELGLPLFVSSGGHFPRARAFGSGLIQKIRSILCLISCLICAVRMRAHHFSV